MTLRTAALSLLAIPIGLLLCAQASGQGHLTKTAIAGKEIFVDGYARSDSNCQGLEPPQITIDDPQSMALSVCAAATSG